MNSPTGNPIAAPVAQSDRILIIDALRGFAILGILLMNIPGFSLPGPAGFDPTVMNEYGTANFKVWHFVEWLPEGTQRAIFSMLFGAGIILFTSRLEARIQDVRSADYFMRRQLWLLVFGLINIYVLLWWGDILFDYACYGMILYTFRRLSPKALLIAALISFIFMTARENRDLYKDKRMIHRGELVAALDTTKVKLTDRQKSELGAMEDFKEKSGHDSKVKRMKNAVLMTTGNYEDVYDYRTDMYVNHALPTYSYMAIWDVLLFMFLGMAFFKMGILTGNASIRVYWALTIIGLGLGLTISYFRLDQLVRQNFDFFTYTKNAKVEFYTLSRMLRALGIFGFLMLLYKSGWFKWLFALMRPVGQMAFTNYLTQSLICGIIFYGGFGFGLMGSLERKEVYYVVGAIWVVQIIWSHIWLRFFYFGPLEWCWRSLTYWKKQKMRRVNNE